jgi:predicted HicB family RNase H-like nuclease
MAIKELKKPTKNMALDLEKNVENFILKGGSLAENLNEEPIEKDDDHRMTLRIPKELMAKIDTKRKQRIGKISRNLWILETIDRATRK